VRGRDIIVIGASAGGIEALSTIVAGLPADFPAAVFVVLHTSADSPNVLANILDKAGPLPARYAVDGERIAPGRVYVAPADRHLLIEPTLVRLTQGPKENHFRPAVDPLFRSAAQTYGPRVVGVILTGGLNDGTSGLLAVKQLGGTAVVQDPREALIPAMPLSALQHVRVDHCLPLAEIAPRLVRLATSQADEGEGVSEMPEMMDIEIRIAKEEKATEAGVLRLGEPSLYACPECHGVLLRVEDGSLLRFRCHTGHAYTLDALLSEMDEKIEGALWSAVRAIEESVMLTKHAAGHARERGGDGADAELRLRAEEAQRRADLVRQALMDRAEGGRDLVKSLDGFLPGDDGGEASGATR
jgi:two-component system, chemotaxis family, protein-glutamate methylesterase/glutaminase